jgi:O-acetyl-ADP-ribose deacetylase (regulator of RNase III)
MNDIKWCSGYLKTYNGIKKLPEMSDKAVFRALQNITMPHNLSEEFYERQDRVLQDILSRKEITDISTFNGGITLYKGDITLIKADAIVNACNNKMLGCFVPGHHCIDNAIHSFAGLQVRRDMMEIMKAQGHDEPNGDCKVTSAYNLPSQYIFHTVGPIYSGIPQDEIDLMNCYKSCLRKAGEMGLKSIVFCCLSTGVFGYPIEEAATIAIRTVKEFLDTQNTHIKQVVFNVFTERDYEVYQRLLARD